MTEQSTGTTYGTDYHVPVLVEEVLEWLDVGPTKTFVDGTLGGGGHSNAILDASAPDGIVYGIDRDPEARAEASERLAAFGDRFHVVAGNYGDVRELLDAEGLEKVDGFLVDAGVSSHQLDDISRGFSFREAGPLDMRMGKDAPTLEEYLADVDERELGRVLKAYGEIRGARRVARGILNAFHGGEIKTTSDLANVVEVIAGKGGGARRQTRIHPATLAFQALRIAVNDELTSLERAVESVPDVVNKGGRAVFITFHSLEDRIVKHGLRRLTINPDIPPGLPVVESERQGPVEVLTRKPIKAGESELAANPRSRSAKLRAVRVL